MLILEDARNGVKTIKYNNKYLHSKYDPVREAKLFVEKNIEFLNGNKIIVIGLGLGYHISEILNRINKDIIIEVFEYSKEIISLCKEVNPRMFNVNNIKIISKDNYFEELTKAMDGVDDILIHKPSMECIKEMNLELYEVLNRYIINRHSIIANRDMLNENKKYNKLIKVPNINNFIKNKVFKGKPCLVLSAGPSLENELKKIKKSREKFNIIIVGSVFKRVIDEKINPDFVVIIDGKESVYNQFKGLENENIPLCFLETASRRAVKEYNGPKYIFFNDSDKEVEIKTGKTVAVAALNLAIKFGATELVLLGQDLMSINGKTHIDSYCKMYGIEGEKYFKKNILAKDINGNYVETIDAYVYFKKRIEETIKENKGNKFYNCSKGLFIEGCIHCEFDDYLEKRYLNE